jgi:hypothetical protein
LAECDLANIEAFKTKYSRVFAAIASWEFADVPWLLAETYDSTGPQPSELKHIEQFLSAHPTTLRVVEDLLAMGDKPTWATDDQRKGLADAKVSLNNADKLVQEVSILLGCMVITNSILSDGAVEASKTYVTSKLKISLQGLPSTLREKLALYSRGAKKPSGEVASSAAETSAIVNAIAAKALSAGASTATSADEKPTKKIRRITCS